MLKQSQNYHNCCLQIIVLLGESEELDEMVGYFDNMCKRKMLKVNATKVRFQF